MKILFSILIPTYNGEKTIGKLLNHFTNLPKEYITEVIIIDSESADNTVKIIDKYRLKLPNFRLIKIKKKNFSHSSTRNLGVRLASGKYVCFFSQDAIP